MKPTITPRLLSARQTAQYLGMGRSDFYARMPELGIPRIMITKRPRWDVKDLDTWIERQKEVSNAHA